MRIEITKLVQLVLPRHYAKRMLAVRPLCKSSRIAVYKINSKFVKDKIISTFSQCIVFCFGTRNAFINEEKTMDCIRSASLSKAIKATARPLKFYRLLAVAFLAFGRLGLVFGLLFNLELYFCLEMFEIP